MTEIVNKFAVEEYNRCVDNPYYWATTYLKVKRFDGELVEFTTLLSEEEFNNKVWTKF